MDSFGNDGFRFEVTDAGPSDGEPVICLHGFPQLRAAWEGVVPHLTGAGFRVLAPDQRGYSPNARPVSRRAYRLEHLVGDVLALADSAGARRFHVVGHDWGGAVAWALGSWFPERLLSLTSLATPHPRAMLRSLASSSQLLRSWYIAAFQLPWLPEAALTHATAPMERALRASGLDERHRKLYLEALESPGAATGAINWYRAAALPGKAVGPSTVSTLYVYGTGDTALGRRAADLTESHVSAPYRYVVLEGASHWLPEMHAHTVGGHLLDHFATS